MGAYFVTATGTDIGKTFVSACLLRHWRAAGLTPDAFKPLVSGIDPDDPTGSDPAALIDAMGLELTAESLDRVSPWRFAAPLAPNMAARKEGRLVPYSAMLSACRRRIADAAGPLLIEGVGGVMAPVDDGRTVLDWMAELGLPAILVAGTYLGTISHILTAVEVVRARQQHVAALVLSETPGGTVPPADTVAALRPFLGDALPILHLPRLPAGCYTHMAVTELASVLSS
ncbi:dethiobiotin synthase [Niveispirillum cyanobacteriorum]|uniref:ATP-dependent dethiobiotin synthetase BioD n=1 Tax=Niveispirillum cyanobacteriorum TaxID=1612173 RepID=A0A2K9NL51_9PROT|nr:dethiobiotin synthase [Niveispirillum cyanobacteriorum]AUN33763.1 dethiobiotin synthase [Niveispirillum cyanobacteriorum]GGE82575.1 ATP-dependent dethiobiotin synthetase BioD [Niveispirillum cyanobacteriorum]